MFHRFAPRCRRAFVASLISMLMLPVALPAQTAPAPAAAPAPVAQAAAHDPKDVTGKWQGTLAAGRSLRVIFEVTTTDKGLAGKFYSIDQAGVPPLNVTSVTLNGVAFSVKADVYGFAFDGTVSADGNSIVGQWKQGGTSLPLTVVRSTKETAWEIPAVAAPVKQMAADANPSFDVATIKPNDSGVPNMQGITLQGRNFVTKNTSLVDLICFTYQVQAKQIVGAPDWFAKDRYDIAAVPDIDGAPSLPQLRDMIKKLLADRFKLTFHKDQREMSAFVLTTVKVNGQPAAKLTATQMSGPLPGLGFGRAPSGLTLTMVNAMASDLTNLLQANVVDRPVVDRTGLTGHYDAKVTFTPDDSMFNGQPPKAPVAEGTEPAPALTEALLKEMGLKLESTKTQVDVMAVDHVEKPSQN